MFKRTLALVSATLLGLATYAVAADLTSDHPDTYVVRKGDTLWDISARFLKQPWLWPEIWQANPQLRNPHQIYPGDVLNLVYLNGQPKIEMSRSMETGPAIDAIPLADVEAFLKAQRVVAEYKDLPYVVGIEGDQERVTDGQLAYARGIPDAQAGDMYAIMRPMTQFYRTHRGSGAYEIGRDDLDFNGDMLNGPDWDAYFRDVSFARPGQPDYLGTEMKQMSLAQVTRPEGHGIESATLLLVGQGVDVRPGDRLMPVESQPFDLQFFPHPPKRAPDVSEYSKFRVIDVPDNISGPYDNFAISGAYGIGAASTHEVVGLSVGTEDGVDNGTVFSVWRIGTDVQDKVANNEHEAPYKDHVRLPDEFRGHVMVFRAFDRMSFGLLMDGTQEIHTGDVLKGPDATR